MYYSRDEDQNPLHSSHDPLAWNPSLPFSELQSMASIHFLKEASGPTKLLFLLTGRFPLVPSLLTPTQTFSLALTFTFTRRPFLTSQTRQYPSVKSLHYPLLPWDSITAIYTHAFISLLFYFSKP